MKELLNLCWDKRTAFNIMKFPFIICLRVPVTLFFIGIAYINDWSDVVNDKLPGWDSYSKK
jgi:hypothetical protein